MPVQWRSVRNIRKLFRRSALCPLDGLALLLERGYFEMPGEPPASGIAG
jgi:hypothetical protein